MNETEKPKKRRFLKPALITVILGTLMITVPVGFYLSWTLIDLEPGDFEDLILKDVDTTPIDNGYPYINRQYNSIVFPPSSGDGKPKPISFEFYLTESFSTPEESSNSFQDVKFSEVAQILELNKTILEETRKAALSERIQPSVDIKITDNFPELMYLRRWMYLHNLKIWNLIANQQFPEALAICRDQYQIGQKIQQATTTVIMYLVTTKVFENTIQNIRWINLHPLCPPEVTTSSIALFDKHQSIISAVNEDLKLEFKLITEFIEEVLNPNSTINQNNLGMPEILQQLRSFWFLKNETFEELATLTRSSIQLSASNEFGEFPDYSKESLVPYKKLGPLKIPLKYRNRSGREILELTAFSIHLFENAYQQEAGVRLTQIKLALLAYYREHKTLPDSLKELSPQYFKEIPKDPFTGKSFRYNKEERTLYSLGKNKFDDGGTSREFSKWNDKEMSPTPHIESSIETDEPTVYLDFPGMVFKKK